MVVAEGNILGWALKWFECRIVFKNVVEDADVGSGGIGLAHGSFFGVDDGVVGYEEAIDFVDGDAVFATDDDVVGDLDVV